MFWARFGEEYSACIILLVNAGNGFVGLPFARILSVYVGMAFEGQGRSFFRRVWFLSHLTPPLFGFVSPGKINGPNV